MRVSIPERTVDAWVAIAIAQKFKNAPIWLPTNQGKDDWDLAFGPTPRSGKLVIFENKSATPIPNSPGDHRITINRDQLDRYCESPQLSRHTFYVLPEPPWAKAPPPVALPEEADQWRRADRWLHVLPAPHLERYLRSDQKSLKASELPNLPTRTLASFLEELHACRWRQTWVKDLHGERYDDWFPENDRDLPDDLSLFSVKRRRRTKRATTTLSPVTTLIPLRDLSSSARARLAQP